jgi:hypothetical protein
MCPGFLPRRASGFSDRSLAANGRPADTAPRAPEKQNAPLSPFEADASVPEETPVRVDGIARKFMTTPKKPVPGARQYGSDGSVAPGRVFGGSNMRVMR